MPSIHIFSYILYRFVVENLHKSPQSNYYYIALYAQVENIFTFFPFQFLNFLLEIMNTLQYPDFVESLPGKL